MSVSDPNAIEAFLTDAAGSHEPVETAPVQSPAGDDDAPVVAIDGEAGMLIYTLLVPLVVNGEPLRRVCVRLAELGDIDDWGKGTLATNRDLLVRLTGLHPAVLRRLKWPDAEAVIKLFEAAVPAFVVAEIERDAVR